MTYPNRPTHPDFWRLRDIVVGLDIRADNEDDTDDIIGKVIDFNSLAYMAGQRVLRLVAATRGQLDADALAALWLDAFIAGAAFQADKDASADH